MLDFCKENSKCTGCSACFAVCPVKCIQMKKDKEGFLYPEASADCIHCGKCKNVCPIENPFAPKQNEQKDVFCAVTKDKKIWRRSASGGAFSEICKAFGDSDTVVFGAAWNGFLVEHIQVVGVENIEPICKSKYIASDIKNTFSSVKDAIIQNKKVIFCGTPCQVAGLRKFLGKDYSNILFIDFICHGVGSPSVFNDCIKILQKQLKDKVVSYEFRAKRSIYEMAYLSKLNCRTSTKYLLNDPYIQLFLNQTCLRPSCVKNCDFRDENRQGDITIADFKGSHKLFPSLIFSTKNHSSVIINTEKGKLLAGDLKANMFVKMASVEDIKTYNPLYYRQTYSSTDRDDFFESYINSPKETIITKTNLEQIKQISFLGSLFMYIPKTTYRYIKYIIHRFAKK